MKLKILFLTHRYYPNIGGIEVNSEILATAFFNAGHSVHLMTWTEQQGERKFPFKVIRKPSLMQLIKEHQNADVVFENNPCLRLAWPAIFFRKPSVIALRTWISRFDGKLAWQDKIKFVWLKRINQIIAVSEEIKNEYQFPATVIGNPYRSSMFKILPDIERNLDFVFLGRLVSDKGAAMAVNSFVKLFKVDEKGLNPGDFTFTIIGDGPELENLKQLVRDLNIAKHVLFTGNLRGEELVKCLNKHKFLLVPSLWKEPFGNVALEGLACGCLPIVSDGGGLPDAVGDAGLVFKRGNDDDLLRNMRKVIDDKDLESKLRANATKHLMAHQPNVVADKYLAVIDQAFTENN